MNPHCAKVSSTTCQVRAVLAALQNAIRQQDGTTTASLIERIADMANKIGARRSAAFGGQQ
jgi:hypothetical protein